MESIRLQNLDKAAQQRIVALQGSRHHFGQIGHAFEVEFDIRPVRTRNLSGEENFVAIMFVQQPEGSPGLANRNPHMLETPDIFPGNSLQRGDEDGSARFSRAFCDCDRQVAAAGNDAKNGHQSSLSILPPRLRSGAMRRLLSARMKAATC